VGIEREQPLVNHAGGLGPEGRKHGVSEKEESGQQTTVIHGELKKGTAPGSAAQNSKQIAGSD
jgi:hypothetical protein